VYHRVTATASRDILLAPAWCAEKWNVLNGIEIELRQRGSRQGSRADTAFVIEELPQASLYQPRVIYT
jgi:radical SAM superfamily enzyme